MDSSLNDPRLSIGGLVTHTHTVLVPHQCPPRVAPAGAGGPVVASPAPRGEGIFERESTPTVAVQRILGLPAFLLPDVDAALRSQEPLSRLGVPLGDAELGRSVVGAYAASDECCCGHLLQSHRLDGPCDVAWECPCEFFVEVTDADRDAA